MTENALAVQGPSSVIPQAEEMHTMLQMADVLLKSGMLPPSVKNPQAAFAIIQKGRELAIQPMYALSNINVISNKPTCSAELMRALIYRDHGDKAFSFTESTEERCTVRYKRRGEQEYHEHSFTMADAARARIAGGDNWQKYPADMLRARCTSAVARMHFPDSIGGMYTPEEMGADVEIVDGEQRVLPAEHEPQSLAVEFDQNFDAAASHPEGGRYPQASPDKPATANQLATIEKLCRLLNEPVGVPEGASSAQASERITELSRIYNERKGTRG